MILNFKNNSSIVYSLFVNPSNKMIYCGGINGSMTMYHLSVREPIALFAAQADPIVSIDMKCTIII